MTRILLAASAGFALMMAHSALAYETKVFSLPNNSYIHDVAPAPGGLVWWTGQRDGVLGILDPRTGTSKLVNLGEGSAPHGVIQSKDGKAWITDGGQNAIVSYDPKTEEVKVYKLPADTGYTNLNTPTEDGDGNIWFTGQNGVYGKVDVRSGEVSVWRAPRGRGPYGITTTPDGNVWFVSLANNYLGQVDRKTGEVKVIDPPVPNAGTRRVWSDSKGDLWVSEWNTGHIARYSPATGQWSRWAIPDSPNARLYAVYVDDKDVVWVSNWADNTIWSFDPKTEKFDKVPASGGRANVRQIAGAPGFVYIPESGNAKVVVIDTGAQS